MFDGGTSNIDGHAASRCLSESSEDNNLKARRELIQVTVGKGIGMIEMQHSCRTAGVV